jgi:amidase
LVLPIVSGVDWHDAEIVPLPLRDPRAVEIQNLRVAFHADNGVVRATRETEQTVEQAAKALSTAGARVDEVRPPGIDQTYEIYLKLFCADGGAGIEALLRAAGTTRVHPLMQRVLEIQRASALTTAEFGSLVTRWDAFRSSMLSFIERYDAVLCPVCAFPGMVHGSTYDILEAFSYTMTYNLTGWPAAVVRAETSPEGLPIGVQVAARPWREDVALSVVQFLEGALGGFQPPAL